MHTYKQYYLLYPIRYITILVSTKIQNIQNDNDRHQRGNLEPLIGNKTKTKPDKTMIKRKGILHKRRCPNSTQ